MSTIVNYFTQTKPHLFNCELCYFTSSNKKDFVRHTHTNKHIINQNQPKSTKITHKNPTSYTCHCGKIYKDKSGLWRHTKICKIEQQSVVNINTIDYVNEPNDKDFIMLLIKEQSDIKHLMLEIIKNGTNNNNTINSHNKAFNLNFFLNETCKNAMNINEFVDSIKLELSDLMELGEIGYVAGMSKIITKNLNALDETIRPIHCTDTKRETFYVKDEDKWEKEDVETKKLKKLIFRLSNKTYKLMPKYREMYPDYDSSTSTHSDEYCKIIIEAMMCDPAKDDKIIRNISKITAIAGK